MSEQTAAAQAQTPSADVTVDGNSTSMTVSTGEQLSFQQKQALDQVPAQRPDDVPEKFWDAENGTINADKLMASYKELEQRQSNPAEPKDEPKGELKVDGAPKEGEFSLTTFTDKIVETGELSDEDVTSIVENIPGLDVDTVKAVADLAAFKRAYDESIGDLQRSYIGGEEAATELMNWAGENLTSDEQKLYDQQLASPQHWRTAIDRLQQLRNGAAPADTKPGDAPSLVSGQTTAPQSSGSYSSRAEMMKDMRDPRYDTDPKFREEVRLKLGRSNFSATENRR